ncbi:hypothetical protein ND16A_3449 [Thalassotalea sp. ND16A]|nr:hypothetical protein ND16A_3449 [Thalassotalea sp. ND16A]
MPRSPDVMAWSMAREDKHFLVPRRSILHVSTADRPIPGQKKRHHLDVFFIEFPMVLLVVRMLTTLMFGSIANTFDFTAHNGDKLFLNTIFHG